MTIQNLSSRGRHGYTLLELLVIILITAILAAVALPAFFGAKDSENDGKIQENMKKVQTAAENYAVSAGGRFPPSGDDPAFATFFAGGDSQLSGGTPGTYPINPYTGVPEAPKNGNVIDVAKARAEQAQVLGSPGSIYYSPIAAPISTVDEDQATSSNDKDAKSKNKSKDKSKDKDKNKSKNQAADKSGAKKHGDQEAGAEPKPEVMSYAIEGANKSGGAELNGKTGETLILSNQ